MSIEFLSQNWEVILLVLSAPWFFLVIFSVFADVLVGFIDESLLQNIRDDSDPEVETDASGLLILISGFFGIVTAICVFIFSSLVNNFGIIDFSPQSLKFAVLAGILEVLWLLPYFYALDRGGAINTTPLFQSIPIFSLFFGLTIFNEIPTLIQVLAILIIIVGAFILNQEKRFKFKNIDTKTVYLMFVSSATISLGYFLFKDAAVNNNFVTALFGNGIGMFFMTSLIYLAWRPYRRQFNTFIRKAKPKLFGIQAANEGLYTVSAITNQLALVLGPSVMVVSALNAFHPVFTLFVGWVMSKFGHQKQIDTLKDGQLLRKFLAIALITAGAIILVF